MASRVADPRFLRRNLIDRNACSNIGSGGLLRMNTRQEACAGTGVISAAIAQRVGVVVIEPGKNEQSPRGTPRAASGCA